MASFNASQRTQSLRGASAGDVLAEQGLWIKALGSDLTQKARDRIEGYKADLRGIAIDADGKLSDQFTLGVAYSYLKREIKATELTATAMPSPSTAVTNRALGSSTLA